jgi:hypothetical protein
MQLPTIPKKFPTFAKFNQMSKKHKITAAGAVAATAVVLTVTGLEATAGAGSATAASETGVSAPAGAQHAKDLGAQTGAAKAQPKAGLVAQAEKKAADAAAKKKAAAQADERAKAKAAANRSEHRAPVAKKNVTKKSVVKKSTTAAKPVAKHYADNLDGWIRESLDILHKKGIPGTYEGIHRNIIRESSGNPHAINLWDINARNGIPSKGLLQVIDPTFQRYHVSGTSQNIYDPVANITAACNYAADRYGSMDNVNSAY